MNVDVVVVGAGLFGRVIATALRHQGRNVVIVDNQRPDAGSGPAACLMKPSWFSSMGRAVYEPSLKLLDDLYGVHDLTFTAGKVLNATVHWIPPRDILCDNDFFYATVTRVAPGRVEWQQPGGGWGTLEADLVVVAAGIWTQTLLPEFVQQGQKGVAFLGSGQTISRPIISPWAPYRQLVAFNRGDGLWVSDGTAIKQENWTDERQDKAWSRAEPYFKDWSSVQVLSGVRPYAKGHHPCLLSQPRPGLWVASGGAKNGTLAAGWCAHEITRKTS